MAKRLTDVEKAEMAERHARGESVRNIAKAMRRDPTTVSALIRTLRSTSILARAHYDAESLNLAKKATEKANVEQILEIHDRLDVLPKKREQFGGSQFICIVGMPGSPALVPPTQEEIEAARPKPKALPVIDVKGKVE